MGSENQGRSQCGVKQGGTSMEGNRGRSQHRGNQKPIHGGGMWLNYHMTYNLKPVRIAGIEAVLFTEEGSDPILSKLDVLLFNLRALRQPSSWASPCYINLSFETENLIDAREGFSPTVLVHSPKNNVLSGKKRDELDGPWPISPLLDVTSVAFRGLGCYLSVTASMQTEGQWGQQQSWVAQYRVHPSDHDKLNSWQRSKESGGKNYTNLCGALRNNVTWEKSFI